jgi:hypothetical protein
MIWKAILDRYWILAIGSRDVVRGTWIAPRTSHRVPRTSQTVKIITVFFNYLKFMYLICTS